MKMLIIAASATALMCGAAYAQQSPDTAAPANSAQPSAGDTAAPAAPPAGTDMAAPPAPAAPADQGMAAPAAPADQSMAPPAAPADQSMSNGGAMTSPAPTMTTNGNVQVIASPPVPDTPENRAKYGKPLSNAGKHSKPAGN